MFAFLEECFILAENTQLAGIAFAQIRETLGANRAKRRRVQNLKVKNIYYELETN